MDKEFSTFKKTRNLVLVLGVYVIFFLVTRFALNFFIASDETMATVSFFFGIYALMLIALSFIEVRGKLTYRAFQILLYVSLGIIISGLINLAASCFYNLNLSSVNSWASIAGGLYLLFFWTVCQGGINRK